MTGVATMNIKDPEVHRLAGLLAKRRGTSATAAVREALSEALARETTDERYERSLRLAQESAAIPEPFLTDDDLYDDAGLPR